MKAYYLLSVILCLSCQSRPTFERMEMAFSGGFSGETVTYEVRQDGQIIRHSSIQSETSTVGKLSKDDLVKLIVLLDQLATFYPSKKNSGNITRKIIWASEGKIYTTSWSPDIPALSAPDMVFSFLLNRLEKT